MNEVREQVLCPSSFGWLVVEEIRIASHILCYGAVLLLFYYYYKLRITNFNICLKYILIFFFLNSFVLYLEKLFFWINIFNKNINDITFIWIDLKKKTKNPTFNELMSCAACRYNRINAVGMYVKRSINISELD